MQSLPATDDGGGRPLTEDLSAGSDDGEDIAWDADTAEAGEVLTAAGTASGTHPAGAEPGKGEASAGPEMTGPDGEEEFTEADVAFLSAPQEANAMVAANGTLTEDAPGPDAAPAIGESGRWFRPATAKKKYVPIPPEDQDGSAGLDVAPADPEPDGAAASMPSGPAEAEAEAEAGNLLSVVVDARCLSVPPVGVGRGPGSVDFFQPGGIYRDVRLRVLPQVFLADLFARPTDVLGSQPRVDIECTRDSAATKHSEGTLLVQLLDGQRRIAAQTVAVTAGSTGTSTARLSLTGFGPVSLWSPDSPRLYTVQATLSFPSIGSHTLSRRIGFREASFRPGGFFVNGKRLQLFGLNRHQLYPYAGMAMGARAQRKDAEILKNEFNCNMVRCSHYPQSPDFLDACDELGLLVWEEAPGWHNVSTMAAWQDAVVRDVRDMVIRDRSRPSVIIWGTRLNECKNFPRLWAATRQAARELDSTRPSSGAMAFHGAGTWKEDVFAYNDYGTEDKTGNVALKPPFPGLPYMVSEAVGVEAVKPQHFAWTDPPGWLARQAAMHAFGNQRRYRGGKVALTLSGPATLLGDNTFEFGQYGGLGAVWIRSRAGQPGSITLTASHPLLGQAEVQVRSAAVNNARELG